MWRVLKVQQVGVKPEISGCICGVGRFWDPVAPVHTIPCAAVEGILNWTNAFSNGGQRLDLASVIFIKASSIILPLNADLLGSGIDLDGTSSDVGWDIGYREESLVCEFVDAQWALARVA
ncbi:hypothetical protein HG530_012543 [Fusarium avenaceum]|nr:hypothetical protein HG530_012543 [Fusarium avenaceum]